MAITSATDNTTIEAYVPRGVVRYVSGSSGASSAIQGDYIAIGNSLMTCCWKQDKTGPPPPGESCYSGVCSTCCGSGSSANPYRNYAPAPQIFTTTAGYPDGERESYATIGSSGVPPDVPSDAKIERAYLYWTAWLRGMTYGRKPVDCITVQAAGSGIVAWMPMVLQINGRPAQW